jgi:hypothetical protein
LKVPSVVARDDEGEGSSFEEPTRFTNLVADIAAQEASLARESRYRDLPVDARPVTSAWAVDVRAKHRQPVLPHISVAGAVEDFLRLGPSRGPDQARGRGPVRKSPTWRRRKPSRFAAAGRPVAIGALLLLTACVAALTTRALSLESTQTTASSSIATRR